MLLWAVAFGWALGLLALLALAAAWAWEVSGSGMVRALTLMVVGGVVAPVLIVMAALPLALLAGG